MVQRETTDWRRRWRVFSIVRHAILSSIRPHLAVFGPGGDDGRALVTRAEQVDLARPRFGTCLRLSVASTAGRRFVHESHGGPLEGG